MRYVERNPVRAGLVKRSCDYRWSSAAFHTGARRSDPLVKDRSLLGLVRDWGELLAVEAEEVGALRKNTRSGWPCGSDEFIARAEQMTGRELRPAPVGRPWH